jgi:glycyl-tRNA synthetase beta chain
VRFVTVANRETADGGATILAGNQKVLAARLADAKFFWENDLRVAEAGMDDWIAALGNVTFHNKLGSQAERIDRIAALAREIAPVVGADADAAETAARLAKADLSSEMVYEFPELQGVMGEYYTRTAGMGDDVAAVSREHYQPLGPSDDVPSAPLSVAVALADKIDTLTGFWAIDEKPTGSKDPFALRRAALGVIRLVAVNNFRLPLMAMLARSERKIRETVQSMRLKHINLEQSRLQAQIAIAGVNKIESDSDALDIEELERQESELQRQVQEVLDDWENERRLPPQILSDLLAFLHDRLKVHLKDKGIRHDVIDACLAMPNSDDLTLLVKRAEALSDFLKTDDGGNLLQGFKRAHNILTQAQEKDGVEYSYGADIKFAEADEEKTLFAALDAAEAEIAPAMEAEDFGRAMTAMAGLRAPIDGFFEAVQVNAESELLRRNRLNLLHRISATCLSVADLTKVEG